MFIEFCLFAVDLANLVHVMYLRVVICYLLTILQVPVSRNHGAFKRWLP